ncbi:MAG TPA: adenosylcobinamide-GDP ribazoletransferase [Acidimicrobiales bacterium]|nr:adenosylcobinamide-GDP ribazoletransferase [Acidimicrobiales bacterium]
MRAALGFLTPFGPATPPTATTLRWFPVAGAVIGAAVGAVWWGAGRTFPGVALPAALAVTADLVATGMLHVDGLADSADGLLPHLPPARRLEVMAQPDVGAFGVATVAATLLLRVAALATLRPSVALLAGTWCASRAAMVAGTAALPYARGRGLATAFLGDRARSAALVAAAGGVGGAALAAVGAGVAGAAGVVALAVAAAGVLAVARARIGGYTGDVLGAAAVVGETVALVVASAGR